ncbi:beta-eliminating lyase-related protein [Micromonospora sp. BRA006-A]|nr:beta-eliminating lyase-related protein [Micromonospora sp. BRA006-A]
MAELELRVAELLGADAAAFFPSGTMAQQVAMRHGAEPTGRAGVGLHPLSHPLTHERDAYALLAGVRAVRTTNAPRNPTADEVAALDEPIGTLFLELPLRDAGFVLPTWDELVAVVAAARAGGARVHFDGARLWESSVHLGYSPAEIAALADSTYVSFYKSLGGISGAALAGDAELIRYARAWRHRYGGTLFQQWPAALAALAGLTRELPRLPGYVAHARVVAEALAALPGARVPGAAAHPPVPVLAAVSGGRAGRGEPGAGRGGTRVVRRRLAGHRGARACAGRGDRGRTGAGAGRRRGRGPGRPLPAPDPGELTGGSRRTDRRVRGAGGPGSVRRPGWRYGPARRCARRPRARCPRWPPRP